MDTIHKYPVVIDDFQEIVMPASASLLAFALQDGDPFLWARVDTNAHAVRRRFRLAGTGHPLRITADAKYVGTVIMHGGGLVFHLFDLGGE